MGRNGMLDMGWSSKCVLGKMYYYSGALWQVTLLLNHKHHKSNTFFGWRGFEILNHYYCLCGITVPSQRYRQLPSDNKALEMK